jgi:hypothetical protein
LGEEENTLDMNIQQAVKILLSGIANTAIASQCQELATLITRHTDGKGNGFHHTAIDRLDFGRESVVASTLAAVGTPMLALA